MLNFKGNIQFKQTTLTKWILFCLVASLVGFMGNSIQTLKQEKVNQRDIFEIIKKNLMNSPWTDMF